jgi:hypothetical protein
MVIAFLLLGLLLLVVILGKLNLAYKFKRDVKKLFSPSKPISGLRFHKTQLEVLPAPVQKYFNYILKEGQPYCSYARIKHVGRFKAKLDKGWMPIKGEQYATTEKPGFIWKGTTTLFVARDFYIAGKGGLIVTLFSLINIVNAKGSKYNEGELLRWLGESVLYPTNLLPSDRLKWFPIDSKTAKLTYSYNGLSLFFKVTFDEIGELIELETKRYMGEENLETWIIKATNYKEFNAIKIPIDFDVLWRLEAGDFSYADFHITEVEYNRSEKF